jgi:hypothetical protein
MYRPAPNGNVNDDRIVIPWRADTPICPYAMCSATTMNNIDFAVNEEVKV